MSSLEESDRPKSPSTPEENQEEDRSSGEQNIMQSGASNQGVLFQGGQHQQVNINQYFGAQPSAKDSDSPLRKDIIETKYFEPQTILIQEGSFWMGSDPGEGIPSSEIPRHEIILPAYRIGKYPVTNDQYYDFIEQTKRPVSPVMGWDGQRVPDGLGNHPVTGVTWYEALAYCQWLSEKTQRNYSIPNEAQWEKACRGGENSLFPWGDEFDSKRSNYGCATLAPVDAYPPQNNFGCYDLVGNVRQWTCTLWGEKRIAPDPKFAYPWKDDKRNDLGANRQIRRVVRGSSFADNRNLLRCSARSGQLPEDVGFSDARHSFRVVMLIS